MELHKYGDFEIADFNSNHWAIKQIKAIARKHQVSTGKVVTLVIELFENDLITADILEFIDEELAMRQGDGSVRI